MSQESGDDDRVVIEDIRDEVFREVTERVDGCSFDFGSCMDQSSRNQHIHNGVLKVLFHFFSTALAYSSQNKKASIDLVGVLGFNEVDGCLEENWIYFLGLDCDSQCFNQPKRDFLHKLASFFVVILSMPIRF